LTARAQEREVFFVGSIALPNAASVFETMGRTFGAAVRRIPDGETGNRLGWMEWQTPVLAANPLLEAVPSEGDWRNSTAPDRWKQRTWFRLRPGANPYALQLGDLGYARNAIASYREFARLKSEGAISSGVRFMVAIPSPFNLINFHFAPDQRAAAEPSYQSALLAEVDRIAHAVPHRELAIQWDCAHDMQAYDGARPAWFSNTQSGIEARLIHLGAHIPADVELGYHFCYGSFGGKHFVEPKDMGAMVRLANAISDGLQRPLNWLHMPVPAERSDDAYFAPLAGLRLQPGCRVFLGLIHDTDGLAGTSARMAVAQRYIRDFGIATECGFGRRDPSSIQALLDLHAALVRDSSDLAYAAAGPSMKRPSTGP
jgi:hypothetical protein